LPYLRKALTVTAGVVGGVAITTAAITAFVFPPLAIAAGIAAIIVAGGALVAHFTGDRHKELKETCWSVCGWRDWFQGSQVPPELRSAATVPRPSDLSLR